MNADDVKVLREEDEFFTVVFRGNIRKLPFNPMTAETMFGPVQAAGVGHAFREADRMADMIEREDGKQRRIDEMTAEIKAADPSQLAGIRSFAEFRDEVLSIPPDALQAAEDRIAVLETHLGETLKMLEAAYRQIGIHPDGKPRFVAARSALRREPRT